MLVDSLHWLCGISLIPRDIFQFYSLKFGCILQPVVCCSLIDTFCFLVGYLISVLKSVVSRFWWRRYISSLVLEVITVIIFAVTIPEDHFFGNLYFLNMTKNWKVNRRVFWCLQLPLRSLWSDAYVLEHKMCGLWFEGLFLHLFLIGMGVWLQSLRFERINLTKKCVYVFIKWQL